MFIGMRFCFNFGRKRFICKTQKGKAKAVNKILRRGTQGGAKLIKTSALKVSCKDLKIGWYCMLLWEKRGGLLFFWATL